MEQFFRHLHTTCSFTNVTVRFVHRDLRAEPSRRETLHQSYRGSGIHSHRAEGQRVWDICPTDWCFSASLNNMCVSVSVCVGEVPRAIVNTPNCQEISCLFFRADCSCEVWCDKKTFSFLLTFQTWYFSLDSSMVRVSGYCGNKEAVLSITIPDNTTSLQFTFTKVEENTIKVTFKSLPYII